MKELTVKFLLDEDMLEELEELQRGFHEWKNKDGEYPFKDFSLEKTFNAFQITSCSRDRDLLLQSGYIRRTIISR